MRSLPSMRDQEAARITSTLEFTLLRTALITQTHIRTFVSKSKQKQSGYKNLLLGRMERKKRNKNLYNLLASIKMKSSYRFLLPSLLWLVSRVSLGFVLFFENRIMKRRGGERILWCEGELNTEIFGEFLDHSVLFFPGFSLGSIISYSLCFKAQFK